MNTLSNNTALLIVDVQQGFDDSVWGKRNNSTAESHIEQLLKTWRETDRPVIHIQHMSHEAESPLRPHQRGNEFKEVVTPEDNEPVIQKEVNSAFIGTDLEEHLISHEIQNVIITDLTTNHCVSTTTRMAENIGFTPIVVADATAAFDQTGTDGREHSAAAVHEIALANLRGEFATVTTTEDILSCM